MREQPRKKRLSVMVMRFDDDEELNHDWFKKASEVRISEPRQPPNDTLQGIGPDGTEIMRRPRTRATSMPLTTEEICATAPWFKRVMVKLAVWLLRRFS